MRLWKLNYHCLFNKNDNFCLLFSLLPPSFLPFLCGLLLLLLFLEAAGFKEATDRKALTGSMGLGPFKYKAQYTKCFRCVSVEMRERKREKHGFPLAMPLCPPGSPCLLQERPQCSEDAADQPIGSSL